MQLIILFGPPAVGKMAVGRALSDLSSYPLFHNHLSVEPVLAVFERGSPSFTRLTNEFRRRVIEEAVTARLPGLIFTYVWALDDPADRRYIEWLSEPVRAADGQVDFVELHASQAVRLTREGTALRLEHKPSKRNVELSRHHLVVADLAAELNTQGSFFYPEHHFRLDNTDLSPTEAATRIAAHLRLGGDDSPAAAANRRPAR